MSTSTELINSAVNQVPYLRTSRGFPEEVKQLCQEVSKSYIDVASAVNTRVIGIFPVNRPAITGKTYFINPGRVNQSLRQVYSFTSFPTNPLLIPHGINFNDVFEFATIYGTAYDGTNYYPLPYVDVVGVTNQISVMITPTNIVITKGATAPNITSGLITVEFLVN